MTAAPIWLPSGSETVDGRLAALLRALTDGGRTRLGRLVLLGTVGCARRLGYEDLLNHSQEVVVGDGLAVKVLDLETYIALKEEFGSDKDRAVLPVLRQTLRELQRRGT